MRRPSTPSLHFVRGRELARGGMGRVVVAEDQKLGRTVALKLLHHDSPALRVRFDREAAITARLAHPAIVPIYEAGELDNGEPFYAMKLVEGTPLDATIQRATTLAARLALLPSAMAVCEALAYAHSRRISELVLRGDTLFTNSWDLSVRRWAYPSLAARGTIKTFDRMINAVGLAPDLELLVTSDATSRASLWDMQRGRLLEHIATTDRLSCVTFVDDTLVVAGGDGGHLELFDVSSR